jgi:spore germination protein GerM
MELEEKPSKKFIIQLSVLLPILVLLEQGISLEKKNIYPFQKPKIANHQLIPEVKEKSLGIPNHEFPEDDSTNKTEQYLYFIKFYGSGKNTNSRLVKVKRNLPSNLNRRIKFILRELQIGPLEEEAKRGLITTLPQTQRMFQKWKFKDGLLHISFSKQFTENAGKLILQDRIDQVNYSLFEIPEIKGIVYYINKRRVEKIGEESLEIPAIFYRGKRKATLLKL